MYGPYESSSLFGYIDRGNLSPWIFFKVIVWEEKNLPDLWKQLQSTGTHSCGQGNCQVLWLKGNTSKDQKKKTKKTKTLHLTDSWLSFSSLQLWPDLWGFRRHVSFCGKYKKTTGTCPLLSALHVYWSRFSLGHRHHVHDSLSLRLKMHTVPLASY